MIRPVPDAEGYFISDEGVPYSDMVPYRKGLRDGVLRPLTAVPRKVDKPYLAVEIKRNGKRRMAFVHVLVLEAFVGPRPTPAHHGAHDNGVATDNRALNLSWKTPKENDEDKDAHGTRRKGRDHGRANLVQPVVEVMKQLRTEGWSYPRLAARFRMSLSQTHRVVNGGGSVRYFKGKVPGMPSLVI